MTLRAVIDKVTPTQNSKLCKMQNPQADISVPFILPLFSARGRLLRLEDVSTNIIEQHNYPFPIAKTLADILSTSAALAGLLKYEGIFSLQTKSQGPIQLLVVDMTHTGNMRGYAQYQKDQIHKGDTFSKLFGEGYLVFTVDQGKKVEQYQGIVELHRESLASAIEHYFEQSEQLKTKIFIASHKSENQKWRSSALLLQQLPTEEVNEESWNHMEALLGTISNQELLDFSMPYETLLYQLFHEGGIVTYESSPIQAKCRCSREKVETFLHGLSQEELEGLFENGQLQITCEFCNHTYTFSRKDLTTLH